MPYPDVFTNDNLRFRQVTLIRKAIKGASKTSGLDEAQRGVCESLTLMWVAKLKDTGTGTQAIQNMKGNGTDTPAGRAFWQQVFSQHIHATPAMNQLNSDLFAQAATQHGQDRWLTQQAMISFADKLRRKLQTFSSGDRNMEFEAFSCPNPDVVAPLVGRQQRTYFVEIYRNYFNPEKASGHSIAIEHNAGGFELFDSNFGLANLATQNDLRNALEQLFSYYKTETVKIYIAA